MRCIEVAQRDELVGERPAFVPGPSVKRGEQRGLVDQSRLQRQ
jgi:hypothetical protein